MEYALWALVLEIGIGLYVGFRVLTLMLEARTRQLEERTRFDYWR